MPRTSAARAACPRPEHAGSRVHLDGTYGRPGHRRQRYKCFPAGAGPEHVFTELLPRDESWPETPTRSERGPRLVGGFGETNDSDSCRDSADSD